MANKDNPGRGSRFEALVQTFFASQGTRLRRDFVVLVGAHSEKRPRKFDLGSAHPPVLVECKRHTWTEGGNAPSAKLTVWNEAMYFFAAAPSKYRKLLVVLRHLRRGQSLADHYVSRFRHMIPRRVEIWELAKNGKSGRRIYPKRPSRAAA